MSINQRIATLRQWMAEQCGSQCGSNWAYVVPTADPHNNEYIPPHWMCREWLTSFNGSAGIAVVTATQAALWTDSRYWLQAAEQLADTPFILMKEGEEGVPNVTAWLQAQGIKLFAGPADMISCQMVDDYRAEGIEYMALPDAFDALWTERPSLPAQPIVVYNPLYAGRSATEKLATLATWFDEAATTKAEAYLINDLADIAWLLNLRGSDIAYNPVFVAYLIYNKDSRKFTLFTHAETLTAEAQQALALAKVSVAPYADAANYVSQHPTAIDPAMATIHLCQSNPCAALHYTSPIEMWRAIKCEAEAEGMRQAMLRDGVAMVRFFLFF